MRHHQSLPFLGLLVLASFVAMVAGVGDVAERTAVDADAGETLAGRTLLAPIAAPRLGPAEPLVEAAGDDGVVARTTTTAASAALDPGWLPPVKLKGPAGAVVKCGSTWSGGSDADGLVYHACGGGKIHVRGPKGALKDVIDPNESAPVGRRDVAPNAAGTIVYYSVGDRVDTDLTPAQLAAGWGSVHRAKRNANGVWKRDANWSAGPFRLYGGAPWSGRYLTVGADGIVYTSVNAFVFAIDGAGRVRANEYGQYDAAGTRIGGPIAGYDAVGAAPGFNVVEGLAMSADGSYLYATEEDYDYVARFVRDAAGAWTPDTIAGVPKDPECDASRFAAPYDVGTTKAGSVIVANTTCGEIRLLDAALTHRGTIVDLDTLPHGVAIAGNGALILPWRNEIYARS
jgi:hypothetical protein